MQPSNKPTRIRRLSADERSLLAMTRQLDQDDRLAEQVGSEVAQVLRLSRDLKYRTHWQTDWGIKSNQGVGRMVVHLLLEASKRPKIDTSKTSQ